MVYFIYLPRDLLLSVYELSQDSPGGDCALFGLICPLSQK